MSGCWPVRPEEMYDVSQRVGGRSQWHDRALFLGGGGDAAGYCLGVLLAGDRQPVALIPARERGLSCGRPPVS